MAQRARQREALAGGALERHFGGEGLGEEGANSIGFCRNDARAEEQDPLQSGILIRHLETHYPEQTSKVDLQRVMGAAESFHEIQDPMRS